MASAAKPSHRRSGFIMGGDCVVVALLAMTGDIVGHTVGYLM
jgi:hypothetical protein